ncbi:8-amino-7-oxononanoate synthase [Brevibacillus sp. SYSU BS000544]|uniref:8-amino-7-oxononanoate synthase n=1 Tax=Brevibacillus sp. SYSU BS000544 TaxID=3416443 RepID=UPI003CE4AF71
MKKLGVLLTSLLLVVSLGFQEAKAAYLPEYDKYKEVPEQKARALADAMGLKGIPLGEETARLSFELQEKWIAELEEKSGREFDHCYVWLTVDGKVVLGIDPPTTMY